MRLSLSSIKVDPDCQARAYVDEETCEEYAEKLLEGATFPPVVVFFDSATYWLADGFHRLGARKVLSKAHSDNPEWAEIECDVRDGIRLEAVRYALSANAGHGKRREAGDYRKAYGIAVKSGLCAGHEAETVAALLACSDRWARDLTRAAREARDREREVAILAEKQKGASNREISRKLNVPPRTVDRTTAPKRKSSEMAQAPIHLNVTHLPTRPTAIIVHERSLETPAERAVGKTLQQAAAELDSPAVVRWSDLMDAVCEFNRVADVKGLLATRRPVIERQAIPELHRAASAITQLLEVIDEHASLRSA